LFGINSRKLCVAECFHNEDVGNEENKEEKGYYPNRKS